MITFANQFKISANNDGTVRIEFLAADSTPPVETARIYMTRVDAQILGETLATLLKPH